jgi:hypothetical protein
MHENRQFCVAADEKGRLIMHWGDCRSQELTGEEFTVLNAIKKG